MSEVRQWTDKQKKVIESRGRNLLVSAAAGSGKTAVLVERVISMITDPDPARRRDVDRLLVVTFTKAAASEMREKILRALSEKLSMEPDNLMLRRQMTLVSHAHIQTIDSFCLYVVKNYFEEISLDPSIHIEDQNQLLLLREKVADQVLEKFYEKREEPFLMLTESLVSGSRDVELKKMMYGLLADAMSHPWPMEYLDSLLQLYRAQSTDELFSMDWAEQTASDARTLLEELSDSLNRLAHKAGDHPYADCFFKDAEAVSDICSAGRDFQSLSEAFSSFSFGRLPSIRKNSDPDPWLTESLKNERETLKKGIYKILKETYFPMTVYEITESLLASKETATAMIQLEKEFLSAYAMEKKRRGIADFSDIEHFALSILRDETDPKHPRREAARELSSFFSEVIVDEYQDSNRLQEEILSAVSQCDDPDGGNYFMVGDIKQSIYRFRQADPSIFAGKYESYGAEENGGLICLDDNFRSRREILSSVNDLFQTIMHPDIGGVEYDQEAMLSFGATKFEETGRNDPKCYRTELIVSGALKSHGISNADTAADCEADCIAGRIRRMVDEGFLIYDDKINQMRPVSYGDIVILMRNVSGRGNRYEKRLSAAGIPVYLVEKKGFFSATENEMILSILSLIDNQRDDISCAAVLKGPIFGGDDALLATISVASRDQKLPFYDAVSAYAKEEPDCEEVRKFLSFLSDFRKRSVTEPVHQLISEIYDETGYLDYVTAMPDGAVCRANLEKLLSLAVTYDSANGASLSGFLNTVREMNKYELSPDSAEASLEGADIVRIMTIHKSKGLQFPVVFVAGCGREFNREDEKRKVLFDPQFGLCIDSFHYKEAHVHTPLYFRKLAAANLHREMLGEEMRILYVALTRAEQKLLITASAAVQDQEELLSLKKKVPLSRPEQMSYYARFGAGTYLDWILPTALSHKDDFDVFFQMEDEVESPEEDSRRDLYFEDRKKAFVDHLHKLVNGARPDLYKKTMLRMNYRYPHADEVLYKTKYSVSELKHYHMDEVEDKKLSEEAGVGLFEAAGDRFAEKKESGAEAHKLPAGSGPSEGALRGTAMHRFMECFDFSLDDPAGSYEKEKTRMIEQSLMDEEQEKLLSGQQLKGFLSSELAERMQKAQLRRQLYRERAFVMASPAGKVLAEVPEPPGPGAAETDVLIQGIIDAFFIEGDALVLLDYKTDRVKTPEELVERYRTQMELYADALTRVFSLPVGEIYLYSFSLGRACKVEL